MNNIIRFWNQNRRMIILGVLALVLFIVFIQVLNAVAKNNNTKKNEVILTEEEKNLPTESIIGGDTIEIEKSKEEVDIINNFIEKCNNAQTEEAYNMLTDYCKKEIYPTIDTFENGYRKVIFSSKKIGDISNFVSNKNKDTYLVKYYEDALAEGKIDGLKSYEDYVTVDLDEGKLNINNLIYTKQINKEYEKNNIKMVVNSQAIYKDYEIYDIRIENATSKTISICASNNIKSIGALGDNNVLYNSSIYELASSLYQIPSYTYRTYKIKFKKTYSSNVNIEEIIFSDIIEDYEQYNEAPEEYKDRMILSVTI